jgi:hypothetical protein
MTGRTQEEVGIRPGFLVVVRVVDRVLELFVRALLCLLLPLADQRITSGSQRDNTQRVPAIPSDSQRIMILQRVPADPSGSQRIPISEPSGSAADLQRICSEFRPQRIPADPSGSQRICSKCVAPNPADQPA